MSEKTLIELKMANKNITNLVDGLLNGIQQLINSEFETPIFALPKELESYIKVNVSMCLKDLEKEYIAYTLSTDEKLKSAHFLALTAIHYRLLSLTDLIMIETVNAFYVTVKGVSLRIINKIIEYAVTSFIYSAKNLILDGKKIDNISDW